MIVSRAVALAMLSACALSAQQPQPPSYPVIGEANRWNRYEPRYVEVFRLDFEKPAPSVVVRQSSVALTETSSEVIEGRYSLKLSGTQAAVSIRPEALNLQPGATYVVEYAFRMLQTGGSLVPLRMFFESTAGPIVGQQIVDVGGPWGLPNSPRSGVDARSLRIPDTSGITIGFVTENSTVVIDNIRVFRQDSALLPGRTKLPDHGFPRLFNYMLTDPLNIALMHDHSTSQIEQDLASVDLVFGMNSDHTIGAAGWARRLKELNPKLRILPYQQAFMMQYPDQKPIWESASLFGLFNRTLKPEWFMTGPTGNLIVTPDFSFNVQMNHTPFCPKADGIDWNEHLTRYLQRALLPTGLWEGFHFDQPEWYPNPLLADKAGNMPQIDADRDGRADDQKQLHDAWKAGFTNFFSTMRERLGPQRLLFGNAGYISVNSDMLPFLNGWLREILSPYPILANGEWNTDQPSGWYNEQRGYQTAMRHVQAPAIVAHEYSGAGLGEADGKVTPNGYASRRPSLEPRDYRRMRLGLTSVLLDDGYYEYDLVDNTTVPVWFDEYAVDKNGMPTREASGRGYLGQPLADAVELPGPERLLALVDFESPQPPNGVILGTAVTVADPGLVISGSQSALVYHYDPSTPTFAIASNPDVLPLEGGKTYQVTMDYRVWDYKPLSFKGLLALGIDTGNGQLLPGTSTFQYLPDVAGPGQRGSLRAVAKIPVGARGSVRAGFLDVGAAVIDNIRISEGGAGAWRRDFENGIVLVNPTPNLIRVTQAEIRGPLNRTGIRRIRGVQAAYWNNGQAVTNGIDIPPGDGIVLLADPAPSLPMAAPTNIVTDRGTTEVQVYWRPVHAYAAGYVIRYGEDPIHPTREAFVTRHHNTAKLSGLTPGTRYYVQVAAFDYLGHEGPFSDPTEVQTQGTAPLLPEFRLSADTFALVPGGWATIEGFGLSEISAEFTAPLPSNAGGATVLVNGVPAAIRSVSPNRIVFQTPWNIGGTSAFLHVSVNGRMSSERTIPVEAAAPDLPAAAAATDAWATFADDGSAVSAEEPAYPGDRICFPASGLGMVEPPPAAGALPENAEARALATPEVLMNGIVATQVSAQLSSTEIGLFRVCAVAPAGIGTGTAYVSLRQGGLPSNARAIPVRELPLSDGTAETASAPRP